MTPSVQMMIRRTTALAVVALAALSFANAQTFTISAKSSAGGTIAPSGKIPVPAGGSQTFTITPNTGFEIVKVLANKVDVGLVTSYTFDDVQTKGSIKATFKVQTFTVTFSATGNVKISPSGTTTLSYGKKSTVTVTPLGGPRAPRCSRWMATRWRSRRRGRATSTSSR